MYGDSQSTSTAPAAEAAAPSVISSPAGRRWLPANRWARRALYGVAGLLGLWALGWLAVPPLLKWQGEKIASEQLGRAVRIGAVDFKPWTLELTLNDVAVGGAAGAPDQLSVKRIYANAALQSLFRLAPVVDAIQVEAPALRLAQLGDGHYDIDDILATQTIAAGASQTSPGGRNDSASVADADYPRLLRQLYRRADLPGKPRNAIGMTRDVPVPEMEALPLAQIDVGDDAMRQLALQRGVAVKDYLAGKKLQPERLFLGAPRASATSPASAPASAASAAPAATGPWSPRAELALTAR